MTLPSKGRRKITVDDVAYHWLVRDNGDHVTVAVEHQEGTGQTLHIGLSRYDYDPIPTFTPSTVARLIRYALTHGWTPTSQGQAFTLRTLPADTFDPR